MRGCDVPQPLLATKIDLEISLRCTLSLSKCSSVETSLKETVAQTRLSHRLFRLVAVGRLFQAHISIVILVAAMTDSDDPVVASYDVFFTQSPVNNRTIQSIGNSSSPRVLVLQYPAYRPSSRPYNASRLQKPSELRLKPNTGLVEIDVPIVTSEHYNQDAGARYGKAISDSKTLHGKTSHGLAGGFHMGPSQTASLREVPAHDGAPADASAISSQTLGGKIADSSERDPIYLLGSLKNGTVHLSHLDGVMQMRPQLHHLDAEEELNQKRFQVGSTGAAVKVKTGTEPGPAKVESRAIEIKLKDTKDEGRDRTLNENARLLRDIQIDSWRSHSWVDQDESAARAARSRLLSNADPNDAARSTGSGSLKSSLSNGDWLDRMSAPREDGKKSLLAKLRGRERERARRKKAEEEKRTRSKATEAETNLGAGPILVQSPDSEASTAEMTDGELDNSGGPGGGGASDVNMEDAIEIKEEPETAIEPFAAAASTAKSTRKRGRPKKIQSTAPIDVDD
jgi:RPC5 protein